MVIKLMVSNTGQFSRYWQVLTRPTKDNTRWYDFVPVCHEAMQSRCSMCVYDAFWILFPIVLQCFWVFLHVWDRKYYRQPHFDLLPVFSFSIFVLYNSKMFPTVWPYRVKLRKQPRFHVPWVNFWLTTLWCKTSIVSTSQGTGQNGALVICLRGGAMFLVCSLSI